MNSEEKGTCHKCMRMSGAYERRCETLDDFSEALTKIIETKSPIISIILFATV